MSVRLNPGQMSRLSANMVIALQKTADAVAGEVKNAQVLPYRTGELQENTYPDFSRASKGVASVVTSRPYARRLYYHPEYNFSRVHNRFAGGMWFEPYKNGRKKWVEQTFAKFLGEQL